MGWLIQQAITAFESQGWAFQKVAEADVIQAGFEAHHARVHLHVQGFDQLNAISVVAQSGHRIDQPDHRIKLAELILRVNQQLTLGNFEMLWEQGEAVFRITNVFPKNTFDASILCGMVETTVVEMDRLTPCLSVIAGASRIDLLTLNVEALLEREDWIPPVPEPEQPLS